MQRTKNPITTYIQTPARAKLAVALLLLSTGSTLMADGGNGGNSGGNGGSSSLKTVHVPAPPDMATYVKDQKALVALGKALFWDMQTGNDGKQACATCHFHAGADHRKTNQLNPNGGAFTANHSLSDQDFPFHSQHVGGSAGVFERSFMDIVPGSSAPARAA